MDVVRCVLGEAACLVREGDLNDAVADEPRAAARDAEHHALPDETSVTASSHPNVFYVDGPASVGKTFLYDKILKYLRGSGVIVLTMAMSGIAAILLEGGRTVHTRF